MKTLFAAVALTMSAAATAALPPTLTAEGECPGVIDVTVTLDSQGRFLMYRGITADHTLNGGQCRFTDMAVAGLKSKRMETAASLIDRQARAPPGSIGDPHRSSVFGGFSSASVRACAASLPISWQPNAPRHC